MKGKTVLALRAPFLFLSLQINQIIARRCVARSFPPRRTVLPLFHAFLVARMTDTDEKISVIVRLISADPVDICFDASMTFCGAGGAGGPE